MATPCGLARWWLHPASAQGPSSSVAVSYQRFTGNHRAACIRGSADSPWAPIKRHQRTAVPRPSGLARSVADPAKSTGIPSAMSL